MGMWHWISFLVLFTQIFKRGGNSTEVIYHNSKAVPLIWGGASGAPEVEIDLLINGIRFAASTKSEV